MQGLPQPGDVLDGTYEVRSLLGKGGFGAVYLVRQINMDRDVALKVLMASGPKFDEMVKRFRREVMSIRNLTHPNTIRLYDFRDDPQGLLYYTMEALKGKNLKEAVAESGPISPRRAKHILRQICKSLSEAHSQGIVHRDLKPANIMLVDMHGETDFVKVLDFGIAKVIGDAEGDEGEQLTSAGILVGTLRYMSPEQITGEGIGPATDLYALGLITLEMLTGESVFAGSGRWEVLQRQVGEAPIELPEGVRRSPLGPLLEAMLKKRVDERIPTAAQVIAALDAIADAALGEHPLVDVVPRQLGAPTSGVSQVSGRHSGAHSGIGQSGSYPSASHAPGPIAGAADPFEALKTEISAPMPRPTLAVGAVQDDFADAQTSVIESPLSASAPRPNPFAAARLTSDTASIRIEDSRTESAPKKGAPVALIGLGALVVVVAVGLAAFFMAGSTDPSLDVDGTGPTVAGASALQPAQLEPEVVEPATEQGTEPAAVAGKASAEPHWVRVDTGSIRARVLRDDESIGRTPMTIPVHGATQVRLEAEGYESQTLDLDHESEATLSIALKPVVAPVEAESAPRPEPSRDEAAAARTGPSTTRRTSSQEAAPRPATSKSAPKTGAGQADWVPVEASPRTKTRAPSAAADDAWVPVAPSKKTEKKEAVEIPVF
jgi:eukaryotic-like serine/threonine-protein kinase